MAAPRSGHRTRCTEYSYCVKTHSPVCPLRDGWASAAGGPESRRPGTGPRMGTNSRPRSPRPPRTSCPRTVARRPCSCSPRCSWARARRPARTHRRPDEPGRPGPRRDDGRHPRERAGRVHHLPDVARDRGHLQRFGHDRGRHRERRRHRPRADRRGLGARRRRQPRPAVHVVGRQEGRRRRSGELAAGEPLRLVPCQERLRGPGRPGPPGRVHPTRADGVLDEVSAPSAWSCWSITPGGAPPAVRRPASGCPRTGP